MKNCASCRCLLGERHQKKFCSNKCQADYQYDNYVKLWKTGKVDGTRGVVTRGISKHLKRYLEAKFGDKCQICRWHKKHPKTGIVPLEIDHIDGDATNNAENNLRLLCPNCHALTPFFRNYNRGNGRKWRRDKYVRS